MLLAVLASLLLGMAGRQVFNHTLAGSFNPFQPE
jgi:hypothetical protein